MSNVNKMRKLYLTFPILQTLSAKLSWSHYVELLKIDDPQERSFYLRECEQENWGVRELNVELIHPARFLFNAGSTPKAWNKKMLEDPHFKVLRYEEDATKVFPINRVTAT